MEDVWNSLTEITRTFFTTFFEKNRIVFFYFCASEVQYLVELIVLIKWRLALGHTR